MVNAFIEHIKRNRIENLVYVAVWILIFTAPVMNMYVRLVNIDERQFLWDEILDMWRYTSVFLVMFIINNALLNELLIRRRRTQLYLWSAGLLLVVFTAAQSLGIYVFNDTVPQLRDTILPQLPGAPVDIVSTVVALLIISMNLGVKLFFKQERDAIELQLMERQNLEHQLAYLRYQINPHFYMNTLNNIHALVDINPEMAKTNILELSRMLRYILYDANNDTVGLKREVDFLRHYFRLMGMRFTSEVKNSFRVADSLPDCKVPPLLFIIFVENAFKHGISYNGPSFVEAALGVEAGRVVFCCRNSKHKGQPQEAKGGVGLANVRKRLDLIYGGRYRLDIADGDTEFRVRLEMPVAAAEVTKNVS